MKLDRAWIASENAIRNAWRAYRYDVKWLAVWFVIGWLYMHNGCLLH